MYYNVNVSHACVCLDQSILQLYVEYYVMCMDLIGQRLGFPI